MKKFTKILAVILLLAVVISLSACNKQVIDFNCSYDYAIITLPNGEVVEGKVQSWTDFEDGDQIQVKIDGTTYLVHSTNIALMYKGGK